jgi:hypothetical protein
MGKVLFLIASLFFLSSCAGHFSFLEPNTLHHNPTAHPRSVESSASIRTSEYRGYDVTYLDAAVGRGVGLVRWNGPLDIELGLEGGSWFTLGWKGGDSFLLLTQDFLFSVPLATRHKSLTLALKFNHISAHLGDGMSELYKYELSKREREDHKLFDELAEENGMDLVLAKPEVYSRDFFSLHLEDTRQIWRIKTRGHLHAGYLHKVLPENMGRFFLGGGGELLWIGGNFRPYKAFDITMNSDTNSVDIAIQSGIELQCNSPITLRIGFLYFRGKDRRGQLYDRKLEEIGIGIFVR